MLGNFRTVIKQVEIKEKKQYLRQTRIFYVTHFSSRNIIKNKHPGRNPSKIFRAILKMDKSGTQTNEPVDKKVDDEEQVVKFGRWYRQTLCIKKRRRKKN